MSRDKFSPAFPQPMINSHNGITTPEDFGAGGVTMRDYFAAKAMAALLPLYEQSPDFDLCRRAYQVADAMLKERNK